VIPALACAKTDRGADRTKQVNIAANARTTHGTGLNRRGGLCSMGVGKFLTVAPDKIQLLIKFLIGNPSNGWLWCRPRLQMESIPFVSVTFSMRTNLLLLKFSCQDFFRG
jgi:hypothetical protein